MLSQPRLPGCPGLPTSGWPTSHNPLPTRALPVLADEKHGNGADTYLHRVGRAGRFGTKGLAITFVASPADSEVLNQVQVRAAWGLGDTAAAGVW